MSTVEVSAENQECTVTVLRCVFVADCCAFVLSVSFQPVSFSVSVCAGFYLSLYLSTRYRRGEACNRQTQILLGN